MPKAEFNLSGYALVAERITEFYEKFENGRIITTLISRDETIVFRAEVYRNAGDALPAATGWASEREGDGEINLVACLENSETSAIGRALANLGFTASRKRPSYEEMEKAERARLRFQQPALRTPPDRSASGTSRRVAERTVASSSADNISSLTSDVLLLMKEAAERGVPQYRIDRFQNKINTGFATHEELTAIERELRHWILNGYPASPSQDAVHPRGPASTVNTSHQ
jgi:hypothetical protein